MYLCSAAACLYLSAKSCVLYSTHSFYASSKSFGSEQVTKSTLDALQLFVALGKLPFYAICVTQLLQTLIQPA